MCPWSPCLSIPAIITTDFLSLLPVPQTVSFTGQELCFIYMCSICLNDSKINGCSPSISQHLCSDTNKLENLKIWFPVYYSSSWSLAALSVVCTYVQAQDAVTQNGTMLSSRTPPAPLPKCEMSLPDCLAQSRCAGASIKLCFCKIAAWARSLYLPLIFMLKLKEWSLGF